MQHGALLAFLGLTLLGCGDNATGAGGSAGTNSTGPGSPTTGVTSGTQSTGAKMTSGTGGTEPDTLFPLGSWFYEDISQAAVSGESDATTQWLADNGGWGTGEMRIDFTIEVLEAQADTPNMDFEPTGDFYEPDCDQVPFPVPANGTLEGETGYECLSDGDCHFIVVDRRVNRLFEMWRANITGGTFYGGCLAAWDMTRVYGPEARGDQCSSADGAGFPLTPLLFTSDEIAKAIPTQGALDHAIRFILPNARMRDHLYARPGTHAGGPSGPAPAPIYGSRWRLKSSFDVNSLPSEAAKVVARGLQKYGMALADGGNIALTARADTHSTAKWDGLMDSYDLASIQPTDFEVIDTGPPIDLTFDCVRTPF